MKKKTEKYNFKKVNCYHRSRDSKLFGSLLDAPNNIQRRKVLAINQANKLKHLFLNKDVTINVKTKQHAK